MDVEVVMNIRTKHKVKKGSTKLTGKWTVALDQADPEHDPNLEAELAKTLQEEIDWEVMQDILTSVGWTKIETAWPHRMSETDAHFVKEWSRNNLQGHYKGRDKIWLFELEKDAILFSLRWS